MPKMYLTRKERFAILVALSLSISSTFAFTYDIKVRTKKVREIAYTTISSIKNKNKSNNYRKYSLYLPFLGSTDSGSAENLFERKNARRSNTRFYTC